SSECGVLVNSTLKSPGYPFTYPADMDCEYSVPIPPGGPMGIYFVDFDVDYDFVKIANDQNYTFGEYCGRRTGQTVAVYGNFAFITFHSDPYVEKRGFFFHFKTVSPVPPKITLPAVVEALPSYRVTIPVTGTLPIYTAIIRNSTVLVNTIYTAAFQFYNESNCTSVAFNNYGYDIREFSVIFKECGVLVNSTLKSPGYPSTYPADMDCEYSVPIPPGGPMGIYFVDFDVDFDFVKIANDQNYTFGKYCGRRTGQRVAVYGNFAFITFHSDPSVEKRGFLFHFKTVSPEPPKITLPAVVEALPSYRVSIPVTGTLPIYTAIMRNSTVLVNTTYTAAFQFYKESNCTSVAFNKYGYDVREFSVIFKECGVLVNSTLKSPGYPSTYPADMDCEYSVPIPPGGPMGIYFVDFDKIFDQYFLHCRYDFVKIVNDQNYTFGKYCGRRTGQTVAVYGNFAFITFHSDPSVEKRGFFFHFQTVSPVPPKITLPAVVEALPSYRVTIPVTGTLPIYTAIIRNSTVLVNTTYTAAFQFYNESNCTSVAFNNYGYDIREFSVIFKGKEM
ncbi:unnamed protein product, partial [Pocillopora meandrina]